MATHSLYYPYIHIRDPRWLKATLLLFSQVRRMTPVPGRQADDSEEIEPFTQWHGGREPMLLSANLWSHRAVAAQEELAARIRSDAKDASFKGQFGRQTTEAARSPGELGFQIHQAKLHDSLKNALRETELAWKPMNHEPYDEWQEYVELNEQLGGAVMATLAIACAQGEGLDIIGDQRSGPLHNCLVNRQPQQVYETWLRPGSSTIGEPPQPKARELFEFVITFACEGIEKLDAETLAKMGDDRVAIQRLMTALAERANRMDPKDPGPERTQQFKDETADILQAWERDRANMSNFWKRFFGFGLLEAGGKTLEKVISTAKEAAPATGVATSGALAGLALGGPALAWAAGLGIGLFTHATKTFAETITKDRESPYRYLTLMQDAGLVIRADLRQATSMT